MSYCWRILFTGFLVSFGLCLTGCQSDDVTHARALSPNLRILYDAWRKEGRPAAFAIDRYLSPSRDNYFVFTNSVAVAGSTYHCRFAVRSPSRFSRPGVLAITDEQVILWIGDSPNDLIASPETKRSFQ
jgi:hypothetical protein